MPFTISQPGDYHLARNLTYNGSGDAILITASNVTLTGAGFTLTGNATNEGVEVRGDSQVTVTGVRAAGFFIGIGPPDGASYDTGSATVVQDNTASNNQVGILVDANSAGNKLLHNTAQGNTMFDLEDDNLKPCQNGWANNLYGTDNEMGLNQGSMFGCIR